MKYAEPGSISHGTMRAVDLLSTFSSELESLLRMQPKSFKRRSYRKLITESNRLLRMSEDSETFRDEADDTVSDLFDALSDFAPQGCYFGAHEGDGSDYGFWHIDPEETGNPIFSDLSEVPSEYAGTFYVFSDHGNVTLYEKSRTGKPREIWGMV